MGGVPSVPTDQSRTLQVIGAGFSRTGTVSMTMALEKLLDGPVLHGGTQIMEREDAYAKLWCEILANRHNKPVLMKLLREATAGFSAITDMTAVFFLAELVELYPDAKVVLVTRDPDRWWKSMQPLIKNAKLMPTWVLQMLLWPCPTWRWAPVWIDGFNDIDVKRFGPVMTKDRLNQYHDWVRTQVPAENLVVMEIKDGWEPLAKAIGKPIPNEPFPQENEAEALDNYAKKVFLSAGLTWVGIWTGAGVLARGGLELWRRSMLA